jgi:DNA-binding NtrC family response regulator
MEDKKILVVDDEILVCWSLKKKLEMLGFKVATANSGETAIEILKQQKFDALVTDLHLPGVDGFFVGKTAKTLTPDIKVFMVSAFGDEDSRSKSEKNNFRKFFDKPFDIEEMTSIIACDFHSKSP